MHAGFDIVLNRTECLEELLEALLKSGIHGGTVVDSTGMMRVIDQSGDDLPMFAALRQLFDPERKSSKTLVMVLDDAQVAVAREVINRVTGRPGTSPIQAFCLPFRRCLWRG